MTTPLADATERERIATAHDQTLFVEAGAGSGKTSSLVTRMVSLVAAGVPVTEIAAITFTEAAAAELRTRVRQTLERAERGDEILGVPVTDDLAARAGAALDALDDATVCTLHAFAQRLLTAVPVEAGLPPAIEVHDDISSALAFERRWRDFEASLLDDDALATVMRTAMVLGVDSRRLQSMAGMLDTNWDLAEEARDVGAVDAARAVTVDPAAVPVHDVAEAWGAVIDLAEECTAPDDTLYVAVDRAVTGWYNTLQSVRDDPYAVLEVLQAPPRVGKRAGAQGNWPDDGKARMHEAIAVAHATQAAAVADITHRVLTRMGGELAAHTLDAAERRRRAGRLEFHDLLVLARRVLRADVTVRRRFHERYRTLLIDEFQDTDPIQVELAVRIAADPDHDPAAPWDEVPVDPGRLFFVGDPKQSIYRFRRADIDLFSRTADRHATGFTSLSVNFRTTAPVLDVVNAVFADLIEHAVEELPDGSGIRTAQPAYVALKHHRPALAADPGPPVLLLGDGTPHDRAEVARETEAADVAGALVRARDERWLVADDDADVARPCRWSDMAVLLPSRTSLPYLRIALEEADVPYRLESGTLVFGTTEIADVLSILRAVDDPGDHIAIVGALRSAAYGCGDDELAAWVGQHGSVSYLGSAVSDDTAVASDPAAGRVERSLADLRARHRRSPFESVSTTVERVVRERRLMELSLAGGRHRDAWRLYRVFVDHARAFADAESGGLRDFLEWARLQRDDKVRATSPVLPEADVDAVRILTIHGAKGLEFPVCAVSGLSARDPSPLTGASVQFRPDGGFEVHLRSGMETTRFQEVRTLEETMDTHERIRLLYVGLTRARDHLIVSTHHTQRAARASHGGRLIQAVADIEARTGEPLADRWTSVADLGAQTQLDLPADVLGHDPEAAPTPAEALAAVGVPIAPADAAETTSWADARARWVATRDRTRAGATRHLTATGLARTLADADGGGAGRQAPELGERTEPETEPWRRGRAGTSVGSAVHAVLHHADLADPTGADVAGLARWQATVEGIPDAAGEIEAKARAALASRLVQRAVTGGRWWREVHVAVPLPDDGGGTRLFEGFVDLLFDDGDGLVVVDYKTDSVPTDAAVEAALDRYTPQAAAYAVAVEAALGRPVVAAHFLFLRGDVAVDAPVPDLAAATATVRAALETAT